MLQPFSALFDIVDHSVIGHWTIKHEGDRSPKVYVDILVGNL